MKRVKLSKNEVLHIARLANLTLTETEISVFQKQLSQILEYVGQLQEINTEQVKMTKNVIDSKNVTCADGSQNSRLLPVTRILNQAKYTQNNYFQVDSIFVDS